VDVENFLKQNKHTADVMFSNFKSGAESGWDFSSRWFRDPMDIKTIEIINHIPVDLNSVFLRNLEIIQKLYEKKNNEKKVKEYQALVQERIDAINTVLWNRNAGVWNDYDFVEGKHVTHSMYASNVSPLLYGVQPPERTNFHILKVAEAILFGHIGGIPSSDKENHKTKEQWDFPNAWAPLQHMLIEYLLSVNEEKLAYHVARSFYNSVLTAYSDEETIYEKYNSEILGFSGGGGEYLPQEGFGWTIGVVLHTISRFKDKLGTDHDHEKSFGEIRDYLSYRIQQIESQ
jgi:alpha,alpha-trehalase